MINPLISLHTMTTWPERAVQWPKHESPIHPAGPKPLLRGSSAQPSSTSATPSAWAKSGVRSSLMDRQMK